MTFKYFNTTVCVGSRLFNEIIENITSKFQYNCLCRFEIQTLDDEYLMDEFQYNCLCRFEPRLTKGGDLYSLFQYNCLCRFEPTLSISPSHKPKNFNTTVCVGSSFGVLDKQKK